MVFRMELSGMSSKGAVDMGAGVCAGAVAAGTAGTAVGDAEATSVATTLPPGPDPGIAETSTPLYSDAHLYIFKT